jgi:hypothetical protein
MKIATGLSLVSLALLVTGCGGPSRPETALVSGRVTYRGKPVLTGQIMFYPEDGRSAASAIGPDGVYRLGTFSATDGATPGRYRVTIQAIRFKTLPRPKTLDEEARGGDVIVRTAPEWLVPEKYFRPETTPLTAEVKRGKNTIDFDLPGP